MERRLFFRTLLGSPVIGAAAAGQRLDKLELAERMGFEMAPKSVLARKSTPVCECGFTFMVSSVFTKRDDMVGSLSGIPADREVSVATEFMSCCNARCRLFQKPFALPKVAIAPADPRMVAFVKQELARLAERERQWKREQEARDQAIRRELIEHCKAHPYLARHLG